MKRTIALISSLLLLERCYGKDVELIVTNSFYNEELNRTRNNENGDTYPLPAEDHERAEGHSWMAVDRIYDVTDELDGHLYPLIAPEE